MGSQQVVLITGAAGNLGVAVASSFARAGARAVLVDRSRAKLERAYPDGDTADCMLLGDLDLADEAALREVVSRAGDHLGPVSVLVNTVGAFRAGKPVHEEDLATWDLLLGVNLRSALVACRAVLPCMLARGRGRIVNVASRDALIGERGTAAYAASKAALLRLTESIADEGRGRGVTANCILPGSIDTPQNRAALPFDAHASLVPLDAVADVVVFLASHAARAISGAALPVFGA
jgi:NAD(P)-dependent dehydrogenase (short-subunit alcohol dehydrogenase family)